MSETTISKRCTGCKQIKLLSDFYKDNRHKDGHFSSCKTCQLAEVKKYRQTEQGKNVHRKESARYQKGEKGRQAQKKYYIKNSEKRQARTATNHAISAGKLPRPDTLLCHYCPESAQQYHHWHGYEPEHWLDVVSVCKMCHKKTLNTQ